MTLEKQEGPGSSKDQNASVASKAFNGIHKSKGLEFDTVAILGVENETFWSKPKEECALFFVAASRAKRRLVLTFAEKRARPAGVWKWSEARTMHSEFAGYCGI